MLSFLKAGNRTGGIKLEGVVNIFESREAKQLIIEIRKGIYECLMCCLAVLLHYVGGL